MYLPKSQVLSGQPQKRHLMVLCQRQASTDLSRAQTARNQPTGLLGAMTMAARGHKNPTTTQKCTVLGPEVRAAENKQPFLINDFVDTQKTPENLIGLVQELAMDTVQRYRMAEIAQMTDSLKTRIEQSQAALYLLQKFSLQESSSRCRNNMMSAVQIALTISVQAQAEASCLQRMIKSLESSSMFAPSQLDVEKAMARRPKEEDGLGLIPGAPLPQDLVRRAANSDQPDMEDTSGGAAGRAANSDKPDMEDTSGGDAVDENNAKVTACAATMGASRQQAPARTMVSDSSQQVAPQTASKARKNTQKGRRKHRFGFQSVQILHLAFTENQNWSKAQIADLAAQLHVPSSKVYKWLWDKTKALQRSGSRQ